MDNLMSQMARTCKVASDILTHSNRSRIDIFVQKIAGKLYLSEGMIGRADIKHFGNVKLGILSNEDVFLLKSVTAREGDLYDMTKIALTPNFNWNTVWDELLNQEGLTLRYYSESLLDNIDELRLTAGIRPPIYRKLIRHVLDNYINKLIRNGKRPLKEIVTFLKGKDITEKTIRNRINYLRKTKYLREENIQGEVFLIPRPEVALLVTDYIDLAKQIRNIALDHIDSNKENAFQDDLKKFLEKYAKSKFRTGEHRKYVDLLKGRFDVNNVLRIERLDDPHTISNKWADFSSGTIKKMIADGYLQALDQL